MRSRATVGRLDRWPRRGRSTSHRDSRPALARDPASGTSASVAEPARDHVPGRRARGARRDDHRRRRQHVHRLHRRRRLPERRPRAPARRRGRAGAARALHAHRLHDRPLRGLRRRSPSGCSSARRSAGPAKAAFFNAGTEAVENAVKFARAYTKRPAVIAFEGAFHGRTLLSLSLTSKTHPYKAGLGPFAPEVYRVPFPNDYRGPTPPRRSPRSSARSIDAGRGRGRRGDRRRAGAGRGRLRARAAGVHAKACAGSATSTGSCWSSTRCRPASGAPASFFAIEHYGVEPDLITVAKSIADGPAALGRARQGGDHGRARRLGAVGGTYVGNPVAQAAALAVLDVIEEEGLVERAAAIGETMRARMLAWQERFAAIGDVRGLGAMLAIELVDDRETKQPAPELARRSSTRRSSAACCCSRPASTANCIRVLVAARDHGRRARRGARRLGRRARGGSRS